MKSNLALLIAASLLSSSALLSSAANTNKDPAQYVDQFIGTLNGGHVFAGATLPYGSVKAVYDSLNDNQGGFVSDGGPVSGISPVHDDGTGGSSSLGMFKFLPQYCSFGTHYKAGGNGCPTKEADRFVKTKEGSATASPGYFHLGLASGIDSETTVKAHSVLHRFDYSETLKNKKANQGISSFSAQHFKQSKHSLKNSNRGLNHPYDHHGRRHLQKSSHSSFHLEKRSIQDNVDEASSSKKSSSAGPTMLIDLTNDLAHTYQGKGEIKVTLEDDDETCPEQSSAKLATVKGYGTYLPSFGKGTYKIYFCSEIPGVKAVATYVNRTVSTGNTRLNNPPKYAEAGVLLKLDEAFLEENEGVLPTRIGVSYVSEKNACSYMKAELSDWAEKSDFEEVKSLARAQWNKVLGQSFKPSLKGVSAEQKKVFYSSLYRTFISPTNVTGDNPRWQSSEPAFDSLYCIWDSFRVVHPVYSILDPGAQAQIVRSLIEIWQHEGFLPDCRMSTNKGFTQGGSNADNMLADSYVKGIRDGIDWEKGLEAMLTDATKNPPDWGVQGRGGIDAREKLGYVPHDKYGNLPKGDTVVPGREASRTLEYSFNDFGIALVASGLKKEDVYKEYIKKSGDWRNLWNPKIKSDGYKGFIQPRLSNGSFFFQDPRRCSPAYQFGTCYLNLNSDSAFYEASAWQYSFYVPHNMSAVVELMSGDETYLNRLDHSWNKNYNDIGDEVGFLPSFQYHYAENGYSRTVDRVLDIYENYFNATVNGIPGNDDSGAEGGYAFWASLGMFPVASTSVYLLSTPLFPSYQITSQISGNVAKLTTKNWDGAKKNKYIVSATYNGKPFTKNWIDHSFFLEGGDLDLVMGDTPSTFGTGKQDLPPSIATGGFSYTSAPKGI